MNKEIIKLINLAFIEDAPNGDITSESIFKNNHTSSAYIIMKEDGISSGLDIAKYIFENYGSINFKTTKVNGESCLIGDKIIELHGNTLDILKCERIVLNIIQRMFGIATNVHQFKKKIFGKTKLLDTRKTTPNFRIFEKKAVIDGGGTNHRMSLSDMVLIKDNHIDAAGSLHKAVSKFDHKTIKIEVEVNSIKLFNEALKSNCHIIMLDNMTIDEMIECVQLNNGLKLLEASGNMNINKIEEVSNTGIDFISVGEFTHTIKSIDMSLKFNK